MNESEPPRMATWLLKRTGVNDALIGDLIEQYESGRSPTWYWRQALLAIVVGSWQDVRTHKLLAVRAIVTGWICYAFISVLAESLLVINSWNDGIQGVRAALGRLTFDILTNWTTYTLAVFIVCVAGLASAWIVGRLHRAHRMPMVFAYLTSLLFACAYSITAMVWLGMHRFYPQPIQARIFNLGLCMATLYFIGVPASVLAGGLLSARPDMKTPVQGAAS